MRPGPTKTSDPEEALQAARDTFWRRGYDGAAVSELESALGIGRKSLYDTFGDKRRLYLRALEQYAGTVIERICRGLEDARNSPLDNLERVLVRLGEHHATPESLGCLLGVAMAQADPDDEELAELLRAYLLRLEQAFERTIKRAQRGGAIGKGIKASDAARGLVALTQGVALMGRVTDAPTLPKSVVRAAIEALQP